MGKAAPTRILKLQFTATHAPVASGCALAVKSSVGRNHGIEPGPMANMVMNARTAPIASQLIEE